VGEGHTGADPDGNEVRLRGRKVAADDVDVEEGSGDENGDEDGREALEERMSAPDCWSTVRCQPDSRRRGRIQLSRGLPVHSRTKRGWLAVKLE
jgi:hypothetical protein